MPPLHQTTLMQLHETPAHPFLHLTHQAKVVAVAAAADTNKTHNDHSSIPTTKSPSRIAALATCVLLSTISSISTSPQANVSMHSSTQLGELLPPASTILILTKAVFVTSQRVYHMLSTKPTTLGNKPSPKFATSTHTSKPKMTSTT